MKKFITNYYLILITLSFIIYNIILSNLSVSGILYYLIMTGIITLNLNILTDNDDIKHKSLAIIILSITWIFSKNFLQCIFAISTILLLIVKGFNESTLIKIISLLLLIVTILLFLPCLLGILLIMGSKERNSIYEDTHYVCKNHYEAYAYSAGAMDSFHYSIGKYYEIINIDGIITITYDQRNEVTNEEYENYINNNDNNCKLVGEKNESK